jgi:hypothetical protein
MTTIINIYQPYQAEEDRKDCNTFFIPYDNTANLSKDQREYPLSVAITKLAKWDQATHWGQVSLRWKEKLPGLDDDFMIKHILANPGHDVYFFNGFIDQMMMSYNVWEQGNWYHPHMLTIMEHIYPLMGLTIEDLHAPMDSNSMNWAWYVIGNAKFWDGFAEFSDRYHQAILKLPADIRALHDGSAGYTRDGSLSYFPFIQERLLSAYIALTKDLKVCAYHHNKDKLNEYISCIVYLKDRAVRDNDRNLMQCWRTSRNIIGRTYNPYFKDNCYDWI